MVFTTIANLLTSSAITTRITCAAIVDPLISYVTWFEPRLFN
jgi:hypothetical protein